MDNLSNVFRKKHILKSNDQSDKYFTTSLSNYRNEKWKV